MLAITGLHHVSLPAAGVVRGSDWYERVLLLTWLRARRCGRSRG
jgi:hypothetical protein